MDDRNTNLLRAADPFAADSLMSAGGPGEKLFVINLCAANVPQAIDSGSVQEWGIAGLERYKLYQVSRMEDGRRRYRVRLGFFTSEADAEVVLRSVRGRFATAFSSCLADEDLKHASGYLHKPLHEIQEIQDLQRTGRYRMPKINPADLPNAALFEDRATPTPRAPAAPTAKAAERVHASTANDRVVEVEWTPPRKPGMNGKSTTGTKSAPVAPRPAAIKPKPTALTLAENPATVSRKTQNANGPYHVAAGRNIPDHGFTLTDDAPGYRPPAPKQTSKANAAIAKSAEPQLPRPLVSAEALAKLRAAAQPRQQASIIPTLDSTQTIRTLTKKEKEDENAPKWYVVQLAVSDQPANLETMPRLDIFEAYRLYSVATLDGATIRHALRLGFFSEQVSAEAVLGYLKTFFADPRIERVSDAEQKRFAQGLTAKPALVHDAAKLQSQVITLEDKRPKHPELESAPTTPIAKPNGATNRVVNKSAAPAVKRSMETTVARKPGKSNGKAHKHAHLTPEERQAMEEARLLGLSDTAIRRVEHNPSLLSRLVGKLTK